jgi:hypothetical protein
VTAAEQWLSELANETARELAGRARAGLHRINERDDLQPCCASVARAIAARWEPVPAVSTSFRFQSPLWPRLGGVDIAFLRGDEMPIAIELKCGSGRDALGPCAWDTLKLALGLQSGAVSAGYMLAATTAADWQSLHRGSELFGTSVVETLELRGRYLDWWRQWERLGDPLPLEVPRHFTTRAICRAPFVIASAGWEVRVAAISVSDDERVAWLSTLEV